MQKTIVIQNAHVQVLWQFMPEMIVVTCMRSSKQQPFAGYDGLKEMYDAFAESFNEQIGFKDTVEFFKPNIERSKIHASGN